MSTTKPPKKRKMLKIPPNKPLIYMTSAELRQTFDELGLGNTFAMLEAARRGEGDCEVQVMAVAVLTLPDGTEKVALADMEYGDAEGIRHVDGWIEEIHRTPGLLVEGEQIRRELRKVTAWVTTGETREQTERLKKPWP